MASQFTVKLTLLDLHENVDSDNNLIRLLIFFFL